MYMGYLQNGFPAVYLALPPLERAADHVTNGLDFPPWTAMPRRRASHHTALGVGGNPFCLAFLAAFFGTSLGERTLRQKSPKLCYNLGYCCVTNGRLGHMPMQAYVWTRIWETCDAQKRPRRALAAVHRLRIAVSLGGNQRIPRLLLRTVYFD